MKTDLRRLSLAIWMAAAAAPGAIFSSGAAAQPATMKPGDELRPLYATVDDVAEHWDAINGETGYTVPADLMDWSATFLRHLQP